MSAWLTLSQAARLARGRNRSYPGSNRNHGQAGGTDCKAPGRRPGRGCRTRRETLNSLHDLGAEATIRLQGAGDELADAFAREARVASYDVIVDYLWGWPTEALLAALTRSDLSSARSSRVRLIQVGESAGASITLPAAALRSSGLEIVGAGSRRGAADGGAA